MAAVCRSTQGEVEKVHNTGCSGHNKPIVFKVLTEKDFFQDSIIHKKSKSPVFKHYKNCLSICNW